MFGRPRPLLSLVRRKDIMVEMMMAFASGSLLDLDHFIAAGSTALHDATSLRHRPFGHTLLFIVALSLAFGVCLGVRGAVLVAEGLTSHQLRDATRRGLWLWPFGSTPRCPYPVYLVLVTALPCVASTVLSLQHPSDVDDDAEYRETGAGGCDREAVGPWLPPRCTTDEHQPPRRRAHERPAHGPASHDRQHGGIV